MGSILFCLFYAAMLDEATRGLDAGIMIHVRTTEPLENSSISKKLFEEFVCELLYADDCAIEAHTMEDLQLITDRFADAARNVVYQSKLKLVYCQRQV